MRTWGQEHTGTPIKSNTLGLCLRIWLPLGWFRFVPLNTLKRFHDRHIRLAAELFALSV